MLDNERRNDVNELCRKLLREPADSGREAGVVRVLDDFMRAHGFDEVTVDRYGSIVGRIHGKRPGPVVLLDGHIDVVPVPDPAAWKHDPFGGELVDGRIYGRGSSDMKGAVAAMTCAAANLARDTGRDFAGTLCVAGVVYEECFEGIAAREISASLRPDVVIIGEASELNLKIGQRGRAEIVLETCGVPAHSANPDKGVNAVHMMRALLAETEAITPPAHPVLGKGTAVLTDIISSPYPGASVVPEGCRVTYDRRLLTGETPATVLAPYVDAVRRLEASIPAFRGRAAYARGVETCYTGATIEGERFFPGWIFDENEDYVQRALAALRGAGLSPVITHYSFCTNGSHYAGEAGIRTLGFGPSREDLAHIIDEYIEESQLHAATIGYAAICNALLEGEAP